MELDRELLAKVVRRVAQEAQAQALHGQPPAAASPAAPAPRAAEPPYGPVALASDHGGFELKEDLKRFLADEGVAVQDLGTHSTAAVDYPDLALAAAAAVARGDCRLGIVVDGVGIGSCMAANKVPGVRAATCWDTVSARNSREHNDANVLCLGGRVLGPAVAREIVRTWLATPFAGGRHAARVEKIVAIEQGFLARGASR